MSSDFGWEMEEDEESENDNSFFIINGKVIQKDEIITLMKSNHLMDKKQFESLVTAIIEENKYNVLEYLLNNGYELGILNNRKQTAVHLSFHKRKYHGWNSLLKVLIRDWLIDRLCKINYTDSYGLTYLHIACYLGEKDFVTKCLNSGVDVNACYCQVDKYYQNFTALHFAILNTHDSAAEIVNLLLEHGANVEAKDSQGRMPIHLACSISTGNHALKQRSMTLDSVDSFVEDPQNFYSSNLEVFRILLKKCKNVDVRDKFDNSVLLSIFPQNYAEFSQFQINYLHNNCIPTAAVKFASLLQSGADLGAKNNQGDTFLHLVVRKLQGWHDLNPVGIEILKKLLACGVDINAKNVQADTPLQVSVKNLNYKIVKLLLDHNADLDSLQYSNASKLFNYPNLAPNFECIRNLVNIINLFENEGYALSLNANLEVMKFLVHNEDDCKCESEGSMDDFVVYYGSEKHLMEILEGIINENEFYSDLMERLSNLRDYYRSINIAEFYADKELFDLIRELDFDQADESFEDLIKTVELPKEVDIMKSTKLDNNVTLYEVMKKHYRHIPLHILNNFDEEICANFPYCENIIKGHFAKSILRRYVEKSASSSLKSLQPTLPDLCCRMVMHHLSNEDLLNLHRSLIFEDPNEKCLLVNF